MIMRSTKYPTKNLFKSMKGMHPIKLLGLIIIGLAVGSSLKAQVSQPDSIRYHGGTIEIYDNKVATSKYPTGGNIFLGTGIWKGNLAKSFNNQFLIGLSMDFHLSKLILQIDDYIGIGSARQTLVFLDQLEWKKNKAALSFMFGGNIGYALVNNRTFLISPVVGLGLNILTSSPFPSSNDNTHNEPTLVYYKLGGFIDIKPFRLFRKRYLLNGQDIQYSCLRINAGVKQGIVNTKYPEYYTGSMVYITLGLGEFYGKMAPKSLDLSPDDLPY